MCGIVGAYRPQGEATGPAELAAMRDRMQHRGPDGAGCWRADDGRAALGHRRLSIIDLSAAADQPMRNHDGRVVLVFNGEIYNHAELRSQLEATGKYRWTTDHSDTEVLLHAFEEWGLGCLQRLFGDFAFAIYDARDPARPALHLVRDRVGVKPLYFARTARGEWLFASEIRALLAHADLAPEMDRTAFWHYLTFIVTPAPLTLFRGIFKLPAGCWLSIDHRGQARSGRYWDCRPDAVAGGPLPVCDEEASDELLRLLKCSIRRRMVSDVPFGVLLSGGVDSSMNVALMSELMERPVTTFTIGYAGHEDFNEFQYARRIAERYQTEHHEARIERSQVEEFLPRLVRLQDEPIADNVCIPLYFLAELVRASGTTVIQVGEGADENFLGYWWCEHYRQKAEAVYEPFRRAAQASWWRRLWRSTAAGLPLLVADEDRELGQRARLGQQLFWGGAVCWQGALRQRLTPDPQPFLEAAECPVPGLLPQGHERLDSHAVVDHYLGPLDERQCGVLEKIPYLEMKLRLPEHLLMRVDKLTMAHAVEARVPFLDHEVVEFATRLPARFKLRDGLGKLVLKKAAERYLDHDLIYRRKQGFGAPLDRWFKEGDFGRRCVAAFKRSRLAREGYFDNDYFLGLLDRQIHNGVAHGFHLWTVLNAVLWHESWIEGREDCF